MTTIDQVSPRAATAIAEGIGGISFDGQRPALAILRTARAVDELVALAHQQTDYMVEIVRRLPRATA